MTTRNKLTSRAAQYLADAMRGVRQAPVEVLATLSIALTFSWAIETGDAAMQSFAESAVACLLIIAVAWAGTLLHALGVWTPQRRWLFTIAGAVVVAVYAIVWLDFQYVAEAWRAALLVMAAVLLVITLPAFGAGDLAVERMRRVDSRILLRMIGALLYGIALFAGLALALRAVDVLFELELNSELYGHVWSAIFFVLVPWIVLGGLSDYVRPLDDVTQVAGVAHRIVAYLVPPLLILYHLILYAYVIRIFVTGEIPKNLVSPLVLAAGGLAALALLLFDPKPGDRGLAGMLRFAPPVFLPLAPLGAWALLTRIDQYGWTEFRVVRLAVVAALAAIAAAATVQLLRRRPFALHVAPPALAAVLILAAIGPWSALSMSRRDQQGRLESALASLNVPLRDTTFAGTTAPAARVVPARTYEQIRDGAQYLAAHFGRDALPLVLRGAARSDGSTWVDFASVLGLRPDTPADSRGLFGSLPRDTPIEVDGATAYMIEWNRPRQQNTAGGRDSGYIQGPDSVRVAIRVAGTLLFVDVSRQIATLRERAPTSPRDELPADQAVVSLTDTAGVSRGQMILWNLAVDSDSTGVRVTRIEGLALIRKF